MTTTTKTQSIEEHAKALLNRPYRRAVQGSPADGYLGFVPELPGCMTDGATPAEALANLEEAMLLWFETAISAGQSIPEPAPPPSLREDLAQYSGKMILRMPRTVHRDLALGAQREGVSINQLVVALIARGIDSINPS
jgi:antitoxin HicB